MRRMRLDIPEPPGVVTDFQAPPTLTRSRDGTASKALVPHLKLSPTLLMWQRFDEEPSSPMRL
jgi:hypothetical protein